MKIAIIFFLIYITGFLFSLPADDGDLLLDKEVEVTTQGIGDLLFKYIIDPLCNLIHTAIGRPHSTETPSEEIYPPNPEELYTYRE